MAARQMLLRCGFFQNQRCSRLIPSCYGCVKNIVSRKHSSLQKQMFPVHIWPAFNNERVLLNFKEISEPGSRGPSIDELPRLPSVESPTIPFIESFELPTFDKERIKDLVDDGIVDKETIFMSSLIKIRKKKMNKHKYKKRIDRDIAKIRKIRTFRMKKRRKRQIYKRKALIKKLAKVLKQNPKSDLPNRPYVMYRLKNW